jgi:5-methylcytosine-specific restriction endonuclease McrA
VDTAKERRRWRRLECRSGNPDLHRHERWPSYERSWWETDHIVPVAQGGGACGLENLQTLCYRCHQAKTRLEAVARRASGVPLLKKGFPGPVGDTARGNPAAG